MRGEVLSPAAHRRHPTGLEPCHLFGYAGITRSAWVYCSVVRAADCRSAGPWFKSGCALFCTPPYLRTSKTEIEAVRERKLSTRAEPICCAKARACFRKNFDDSIFLLTERMCSYVPPWPNGQGVGLLIRRLRVRVPQGVFTFWDGAGSK